ncbi:hypothetical protein ACFVWP_18045 [Streptomyces sp. NPDC058175]|uniref:hypothetical protein n=1 Tax=Streptomyces sp. NPDC058175 TaxID=3346367 RepID=UPI0036E9C675
MLGTELGGHFPPLSARNRYITPLELLPQPHRVRAVLADRQVRLDELPLQTC